MKEDTGSHTPEDAALFAMDHAEPEDVDAEDEDSDDGDDADPICCNAFDCPCGGDGRFGR